MTLAWDTEQIGAVHAWLVAGSGLAADHVIWSDQGAARRTGTWISVLLLSFVPQGQDWLAVEEAETPVPGANITQLARGMREVTLSIQCFAGDAVGTASPMGVLSQLIARSRLPSVRALLADASIGLAELGPVTSRGGLINTSKLEPRAVMTVRLFCGSEVSESGASVEHIDIAGVMPVGGVEDDATGVIAFVVPPEE